MEQGTRAAVRGNTTSRTRNDIDTFFFHILMVQKPSQKTCHRSQKVFGKKKKINKQPPNSSPLLLPMGNTHPFKCQIEEEAIIVRRSSRLVTLEKARDLQEQHH